MGAKTHTHSDLTVQKQRHAKFSHRVAQSSPKGLLNHAKNHET